MRPLPQKYIDHLAKQGFHLSKEIGTGLSGHVYLASQPSLARDVAVKFFDSAFQKNNENLKKRFLRESRILAKLQNPNIPYVLTRGVVEEGKVPYMVLEYIDGETLEDTLDKRQQLPVDLVLRFARQILNALSCAHKQEILHRDIKPGNIIIQDDGFCYLIDFSIGVSLTSEEGLTRATRTGEHLGSIKYMSPEQSQDMSSVDKRSDIYSVGIVLLELLTGSVDKSNISRKLSKVPPVVRDAIIKACEHDLDDRYDSADDFLRSLSSNNFTTYRSKDLPGKACCSNRKCPDARWSERGFFKWPNVIDNATSSFCTSCGSELIYQCHSCGGDFDDTQFCGHCGTKFFLVPECEKCGSHLMAIDMDSNTATNGCEKCRDKERKNQIVANSSKTPVLNSPQDFDDGIPF